MNLIETIRQSWNQLLDRVRPQESDVEIPEPEIVGPAPEGALEGLLEDFPPAEEGEPE